MNDRKRSSRRKSANQGSVPRPNAKDLDRQSVLPSAMRRLELDEILHLVSLHATTSAGRQRLATLEPHNSPEAMRAGLASVSEMGQMLGKGLELGLRGIGNLGATLNRAGEGQALLDGPQLANVLRVLDRARALRGVLSQGGYPHLVEQIGRAHV